MIFHPSVLWFTFITEHVKNKAEQQEQPDHTKGFSQTSRNIAFGFGCPTLCELIGDATKTAKCDCGCV